MPSSPNLLPMVLQQALQRAYPSPLPSNIVITAVQQPTDALQVGETVTTTIIPATSFKWGGTGVAPGWQWDVSGEWA